MKKREQKIRRAPLPTANVPQNGRAFRGATCAVLMTLANYQEFPLPTVEVNGAVHFTQVPTSTTVTSWCETVALHWLSQTSHQPGVWSAHRLRLS